MVNAFQPLLFLVLNAPVTATSPTLGLCCDAIQNQSQCLSLSLYFCRKLTSSTITDGLPNLAANCASP